MRRYDDSVETRMGRVAGIEGPEQFLWRGRLWKVRAVLAHWVETGPWWQSSGVRAVIGSDDQAPNEASPVTDQRGADSRAADLCSADLLGERELWRVEAGRGAAIPQPGDPDPAGGVFDLSFDWSDGRWALVGCVD
jgi:Family of unknown function (DUF6504)